MAESISQPNKAFFNRDPRAAEIRRLSLVAIGSCVAYLHGERVESNTAQLLGANTALQRWGIVRSMHVIPQGISADEEATYRASIVQSPRKAVEFVAGQLLGHMCESVDITAPDQSVFAEHDELGHQASAMGGNVYLINSQTAPKPVRDFETSQQLLTTLTYMLDHTGPHLQDKGLMAGRPYNHPLL